MYIEDYPCYSVQSKAILAAGEHDALLAHGWTIRKWKARKGYAMTAEAVANSAGETLWCSPHCVQAPEFMTNQPIALINSAQAATKNIAQMELA